MNIETKQLTDLISQINSKVDTLLAKSKKQEQLIFELEQQNEILTQNNHKTVEQVKKYIQELKHIRKYYADSNNQDSQ